MKKDKPVSSLMPALYSHRLSDMQSIARECGYAIALHGSMQRDIDVVAIPWVEEVFDPDTLVQNLCKGLGCMQAGKPEKKPHGRVAYTLIMGGACFMDLSIMVVDHYISRSTENED